jgi:hypothetical protein
MGLARMDKIKLVLPLEEPESRKWFEHYSSILRQLQGSYITSQAVVLKATNPAEALPQVSVELAEVAYPQLVLSMEENLRLNLNHFILSNSLIKGKPNYQPYTTSNQAEIIEDVTGSYLKLTSQQADFQYLLAIEDLARRLQGQLVRADHFGVNIPAKKISSTEWEDFKTKIANHAALYRYPTGEEWPFVLPTDQAEFETDITSFTAGREPRFELVYDEWINYPLLQFALVTRLPRKTLEQLFLPPYSIAIPGLEDFFRSIYVFSPWPGLAFRFDLYYLGEEAEPGDWQTGAWMVRAGGRISRR